MGWRATKWRERLRSLYLLHYSSAKSLRTQGIQDELRSSVTRSFPSLWHHRFPISVLGLSIPSCCLLYVPAKLDKSSVKTNLVVGWCAIVTLFKWILSWVHWKHWHSLWEQVFVFNHIPRSHSFIHSKSSVYSSSNSRLGFLFCYRWCVCHGMTSLWPQRPTFWRMNWRKWTGEESSPSILSPTSMANPPQTPLWAGDLQGATSSRRYKH